MELYATAKTQLERIIKQIHPHSSIHTLHQIEKNIDLISKAGGNSFKLRGHTIKFFVNEISQKIIAIRLED